jgi:hypothetical protein
MFKPNSKKERRIYYIFLTLEIFVAIAILFMAFGMLFTGGPLIAVIAFFIMALIPIVSFFSVLRRGNKAIPAQVVFPVVRLRNEGNVDQRNRTKFNKNK